MCSWSPVSSVFSKNREASERLVFIISVRLICCRSIWKGLLTSLAPDGRPVDKQLKSEKTKPKQPTLFLLYFPLWAFKAWEGCVWRSRIFFFEWLSCQDRNRHHFSAPLSHITKHRQRQNSTSNPMKVCGKSCLYTNMRNTPVTLVCYWFL